MKTLNQIISSAAQWAAISICTITAVMVLYCAVIVTLAIAGVDISGLVPVRCTQYW